MRVSGKSILVTGAGGGIGEGIARRLASEGAQVIVNDLNAAAGQRVAEAIVAAGGRASFFQADVTQSSQVHALVAAAVQRHGVLDVMVNNAGWTHRNRPALEVSEEEFDRCYSVNVKSIYLATIHATPEELNTNRDLWRCSKARRVVCSSTAFPLALRSATR